MVYHQHHHHHRLYINVAVGTARKFLKHDDEYNTMTSRLETLEHILNSLQDKMCSQIDRHCMSKEEVYDWLITPDMDDEDRSVREMDIVDTEHLNEHGCTICEIGGAYRLTDCATSTTAASCNIDVMDCMRQGGRRVGTFHTHPMGLPIPSDPDLMCGFNWKTSFDFVGGKVAGRDVIVGYTGRPESEMRYGHLRAMSIIRPGSEIFGSMPGEPIGVISFYREEPGPLPSELLEDFDSVFPAEYYDEESRAEFREELESGEIPYDFWDNYDSEGEMDELSVYSDEDQRQGFEDRLRALSNIFDVMVRWC